MSNTKFRRWLSVYRFTVGSLLVLGSLGSNTLADTFAEAVGYYQSGQWKAAVTTFQVLAAKRPRHENAAEVEFYLAESQQQLGEFEQAVAGFTDFLKRFPDHRFATRAEFRLAEAKFLAGDSFVAMQLLKKFHRLRPEDSLNAYVLVYLGRTAQERNDSSADGWYRQAIEQFPGGPLASYALFARTEIAATNNDPSLMLEQLETLRRMHQADLGSTEGLSFGVTNGEARWHFWQGLAQAKQGKYPASLAELELATRLSTHPSLTREAAFQLARTYWDAEQLEKAEAGFQRIVAEWPACEQHQNSLLALTHLLIERGDLSTADTYLQQFQRSYPSDRAEGRLAKLQGLLQLKRQQFGDAIFTFENLSHDRSFQADPAERALTWYYLAEAYHGAGRIKQAWEVLHRIRREQVRNQLAARIDYAEANLLIELKRHDEAVSRLELARAAAVEPEFLERIEARRVQLLIYLGRMDEAFSVFRQWQVLPATSLDQYSKVVTQLAEVAYERGRFADALDAYQAVLPHVVLTKRTDTLAGIAWCHTQLQHITSAARAVRSFAEAAPQDPRLGKMLLALGTMQQAGGELTAAEDTFRQLVALKPADLVVWRGYSRVATLLRAQSRLSEARELLLAAVAEATAAGAPPRVVDQLQYDLAWILVDSGEQSEADDLFQIVADRKSDNAYWADATYRVGLAAFRAGDDKLALQQVHAVLAEPALNVRVRPYVQYLQAKILTGRGELEAAREILSQLLASGNEAQLRPAIERLLAQAHQTLPVETKPDVRLDGSQPASMPKPGNEAAIDVQPAGQSTATLPLLTPEPEFSPIAPDSASFD